MSTTSRGTAAPTTVTIDGRTFTMSPLDFNSIGEIEQAIQDEYLDDNERMIARLKVSDAEKAAMRQAAIRTAHLLSMTTTDPEAMRIMEQKCTTARGMARLFVISCKKHHPDMSIEDVIEMFNDRDNIERVQGTFSKINNDDPEPQKKTRVKKRGRKKKSR